MPFRIFFLCGLLGAALSATAQEPAPPQSPPSPDSPPALPPSAPSPTTVRESHERAIREALQKVPLEKRRQVLEAMKKVWADEDVRASREALRQATENYRRTLRTAMEETDPEVRTAVRPLLDRLLKAGLNPSAWNDPAVSGGAAPSISKQEPPRYLRLLGITGTAMTSLTPEERTLVGSVRERVMADPRVREAAAAVTAAKSEPPPARAQALQELRRITRSVALELEPRLKAILEKPATLK